MIRFAAVCFAIDAEKYGVDSKDDKAVIELLRKELENQPFDWTLEEYSLDEDLGTEEEM